KILEQTQLLFQHLARAHPDNGSHELGLAQSYLDHGYQSYLLHGRSPGAQAELEKGRDILANLVQKSPVRINRSELAHAHNTLATYLESLYGIDDKAEASRIAAITEQAYLAAVALWKQLANEEPDVPARLQDLAGGYSNLARLYEHLGDIGKFKD